MIRTMLLLILFLWLAAVNRGFSAEQTEVGGSNETPYKSKVLVEYGNIEQYQPFLRAGPTDLTGWQDAKFGMFVHWGPVSLAGTEIGWSRGAERKSVPGEGNIPAFIYDNLYKAWDPCKFDADAIVKAAKSAGMKYLVHIAKHTDGFCMWDSRYTDYKITNTPFGRDVVAEFAEACRKNNLKFGIYYSMPDWRHKDYWGPEHLRYLEYMKNQIRELCTNYGKIDMMWFDRDHEDDTPYEYDTYEVFKMVRTLQPGIIINNRGGLPGDFDTPEQQVGRFRKERSWESCITIGTQWSWKPDDTVKSSKTCILTLLNCAGGDGNLLLNIPPMPNGSLESSHIQVMDEIGRWLTKYGQSIYGTRGGPYKPSPQLVSTHKDNKIFLHVVDWQGRQTLKLNSIPAKIAKMTLLTEGTVTFNQDDAYIEISVPQNNRHPISTIIMLELDKPASAITPLIAFESGSAAKGCKANASATLPEDRSVSSNDWYPGVSYTAANAFDDDYSTLWAGDGTKLPVTLEVDLGKEVTIDHVLISSTESDYHWIDEFQIQYKEGQQWKTAVAGQKCGYKWQDDISPVNARVWRLNIPASHGNPVIREFQLLAQNR